MVQINRYWWFSLPVPSTKIGIELPASFGVEPLEGWQAHSASDIEPETRMMSMPEKY